MLITLSLPAILVVGFMYSRSRGIISSIINSKKDLALYLIGTTFVAPIGIVITYFIGWAIG